MVGFGLAVVGFVQLVQHHMQWDAHSTTYGGMPIALYMVGCPWHHTWWDAYGTTCGGMPMTPHAVGHPWHHIG